MWVRNNKGNVFVGNLPPDFPDERLAEAFDPFGIVLSAVVARDPSNGARLRYGFVDIATEKAAGKAISALDGTSIDGCKLNVKARERAPRKPAGAVPNRRPPPRVVTAKRPSRDFAPRDLGAPRDFGGRDFGHDQRPLRTAWPPQVEQPDAPPRPSQSQMAQSQMARADMPEIEPPPRQDFEIVRRPVRRKEPSFQVERRPLPRRLSLPDKG